MNEEIVSGVHALSGNIFENGHTYSDNVKPGVHVQVWFGDRFIAGIQDENLNFIFDQGGKIILEE